MNEENNIPEGNIPEGNTPENTRTSTGRISTDTKAGRMLIAAAGYRDFKKRHGDVPLDVAKARDWEDIQNEGRRKGLKLRGRTQNYSNDSFVVPKDKQSKFDRNLNRYNTRGYQAINDHRSREQGAGYEIAAGLGRVASTIAAETYKLPGYIVGIIEGTYDKVAGNKGSSFVDTAFNNKYVNAVQDSFDEFNEQHLPVYTHSSVSSGNIFKNLGSLEFWATEGAQGLGYAISSFGPGLLGRSLSLGSRLANLTARTARTVGGAKAGMKVAEGTASISQRLANIGITANRIDNATMSAISTFSEAATGAHLQMKQFDDEARLELEGQMSIIGAKLMEAVNNGTMSQEEADLQYAALYEEKSAKLDEQRALLGRDTFLAYSAVLLPSNFLQASMIFGKGASATSYKGRGTFGQKVQRFGEVAGVSTLSEGAYEEGAQTTVENVLMDKAHEGQLEDSWTKGWFTEDFEMFNMSPGEFAEGYLDMIGTTEGQKAVILGGIIGTGMTSFTQWTGADKAHNKRVDKLLESVAPYNETVEDILTSGIYERDNKGKIVTNSDGKPKVNTAAAKRLVEAVGNQVELAAKLQKAIDSGDVAAIESAHREILITSAISYAQHGELGMEALDEKIENQLQAIKEDPNATPEQLKNAENASKEFRSIARRVNPIIDSFNKHIANNLERPTDPAQAEIFDRFLQQELNNYAANRLYNQVYKDELSDLNKFINSVEAELNDGVKLEATGFSDVLSLIRNSKGNPAIYNKNTATVVRELTEDETSAVTSSDSKVREDALKALFDSLAPADKIIEDPRLREARKKAVQLTNSIAATERDSLKYWDPKHLDKQFKKMSEKVAEEERLDAVRNEYKSTLDAIDAFDDEKGLRDYQKMIHEEAKKAGKPLPKEIDAHIERKSESIQEELERAKFEEALSNRSLTPEPDAVMSDGKIREFIIDGRNLDVFNLIDSLNLNRFVIDQIKAIIANKEETLEERFNKVRDLLFSQMGIPVESNVEVGSVNIFDNVDLQSIVIDGETVTPRRLFDAIYSELTDYIRKNTGANNIVELNEWVEDRIDNNELDVAANVLSKVTEFITTLDTLEVMFNRTGDSLFTDGIRRYVNAVQKAFTDNEFIIHDDSLSQIDNAHKDDYVYQTEYYSSYVEEGAVVAGRVSSPRISHGGTVVAKGKVAAIEGKGEKRSEIIANIQNVSDANTAPLLKVMDFLDMLASEMNHVGIIEAQNEAMMEETEADVIKDEVTEFDDVRTVENSNQALDEAQEADALNEASAAISVRLISTGDDNKVMQGISNDEYYEDFEQGEKDRMGELMSFEPTQDLSGIKDSDHPAIKAKDILEKAGYDVNNLKDGELEFLYDHLPIQAVSSDGLKTSIAGKRDTTNTDSLGVWEKHERPLRVQIVDAFLESKSNTTGTKQSRVVYVSSGGFNLVRNSEGRFTDNSIAELFEKDEEGDINEEKAVKRLGVGRRDGNIGVIDNRHNHPMAKGKNHYVPGEIYLEVKHGDVTVPMKLNQTRLTDTEVDGLFELIKVIMNQGVDTAEDAKTLRNLRINETLSKVDDDTANFIRESLGPHIEYINDSLNGDAKSMYHLLALLIHMDGTNNRTKITVSPDGMLHLGEMIIDKEAGFSQTSFNINELTEDFPDNINAVKRFLRNKRRNVIIGPQATYGYNQQLIAEADMGLHNPSYFNYIVRTNGLTTNATITNGSPFKKGNYFVGPLKEYSAESKSSTVSESTATPRKAEASSPSSPIVNMGDTSSTYSDTSQQKADIERRSRETDFSDTQVKEPVYHSSTSEFTEFKQGKDGAIHFGDKKAATDRTNKSSKKHLKKVKLKVDNLVETVDSVDFEGTRKDKESREYIVEKLELAKTETQEHLIALFANEKITKEQLEQYWNSSLETIYKEIFNSDGYSYINLAENKGSRSYVVFNPNQIEIIEDGEIKYNEKTKEYEYINDAEIAALEAQPIVSQQPNNTVKISPTAKKLANDNNITDDELLNIEGTGKNGNILKSDIEGYIKAQTSLNFKEVDQDGNISEDTEGIANIDVVSNIIDEIVVDFKEINDLFDLEDALNNFSTVNTDVNNNDKQSLGHYFANAVRNDASYSQIINMSDEQAFIEMHNLFDKVANDMKDSQKNNRTCQI